MVDLDGEARGAVGEAAAQVVARERGQVRLLLDGGADPAAQPRGGQRGLAGAEPPRARPGQHGGAAAPERLDRGGDGVRPEEVPAALVGVEGGGERGVERLGRGEPDAADDRQREQGGQAAAAAIVSIPAAVSTSSSADAVTSDAPTRSDARSAARSPARVSIVAGSPSAVM